MKFAYRAGANAIAVFSLLTACGDSADAPVSDQPDASQDAATEAGDPNFGGHGDTGVTPNPTNDGGGDDSASPAPFDGGGDSASPVPLDGGGDSASPAPTDAGPDGSLGACFDHCDATYPGSADSAQLILSSCCDGACKSVCPSGSCFGRTGISGKPEARHICQTCAIGPLKSGACGFPSATPPDEFDAYQSCLKACQ